MRAAAGASGFGGAAAENVLLVGAGPAAQVAARQVAASERSAEVVGLVSEARTGELRRRSRVVRLGSPAELEDICSSRDIDHVVVAAPPVDGPPLGELIHRLTAGNVKVSVLPWVLELLEPAEALDRLQPSASEPPRLAWMLKRSLDVVLAAAILLLLLPVLCVAAIAIKIDSPGGPIFFAHTRIGRGGRRFRLFKLRTMVPDAEAQADELRAVSAHPAWLLLERDPRVTRVGRFLRRTSIDELPQLVNVLRGDMSLVGPRPLPPSEDAHVPAWGRRRLDFPPGITGLWQVLGRVTIPFEEMIQLDYLYVTNWTLWRDAMILLRTFSAVLSRHGAN